jgi:hypothetical protein
MSITKVNADDLDLTDAYAFTGAVSGAGKILQVLYATSHEYITSTTLSAFDDSIMQIGEGVEVLTRAITPASASNLLKIEFFSCVGGTENYKTWGIFQDTTANALASGYNYTHYSNDISLSTVIVAGTTSATTIRARVANTSGTVSVNGYATSGYPIGGDTPHTTLIVTEISA